MKGLNIRLIGQGQNTGTQAKESYFIQDATLKRKGSQVLEPCI